MAGYEIRRRLQICGANQMARRPDLLRQLEQEGDVIEIVECLDQCTRCENSCFALVSGSFAYAQTPEELLSKLLSR
ncbi:MAG: DUF1450 domain-containing protein [Bacillota bacterium]